MKHFTPCSPWQLSFSLLFHFTILNGIPKEKKFILYGVNEYICQVLRVDKRMISFYKSLTPSWIKIGEDESG